MEPLRTYGTLALEVKPKERTHTWVIEVEPHVAMRLKRVFPKVKSGAKGVIRLSATPENSRDLEWFMEKYPLVNKEPDILKVLSEQHKEAETTLHKLLSGVSVPKPYELKVPARDYQQLAARVWDTVKGYLLGDDVGLGKTCSAITGLTPEKLPALVVTLTHLPKQWKREIERFTGLTVHILKSGKPYDYTKEFGGKHPDIIISNYHKLSGWAETLAGLVKAVVFDEVHELRKTDSNKYRAAKRIAENAMWCIGLSATPVFNYGAEIYNVLNCIRDGCLGTYDEFYTEWCVDGGRIKDPAAFGMYLRESGLMLRRTREDVGRELPRMSIIPHNIDTDLDVFNKLKGDAIALAQAVLKSTEDFRGQKMQAAGEFDMMMRKATGVAKAAYVAEFVRMLHESSGEKIAVFAWHREVYDILLDKLKDLNPVMYTGTESPKQKDEAVARFISGDAQVILISNRAGAGLDGLQKVCHIGVVAELDWSPATHIQNGGRFHRDGQVDFCFMYFLLSDEGSDPVISEILGIKRQQLEGINTPQNQGSLIASLEIDADHIKRLAEDLLRRNGVALPQTEEEQPTHVQVQLD